MYYTAYTEKRGRRKETKDGAEGALRNDRKRIMTTPSNMKIYL